jgi:very-short-patch-repair endonuclease
MSPKEISLLLNVDISVIKYYKKDFKKIIYSVDEIKAKFEKYNYDTENQGLIKQIKNDDSNLFESILKLTENHVLESEKFTERLYRLFNNYSHETVEKCKFCENNLKFYTFKLGYGNSKHNICKLCNQATNGVSLISQDLFWKIYNELCENKKSETKFSHLNNEKKLIITEADKLNLTHVKEKLNKNLYYLDFICKNKVIEFDGTYYHTDKEKDFAKDEFLKLKGYQVLRIPELEYYKDKNKILKQCINFLNQ